MTSTDSDKHTVGDPDGNVVRDTCTSAAAVSCQPELDNNTSKQIKAKSKTQPKDKSKQPNLNHLRIIISRQPQNLSVKALVPCLKTKEMTL